MDPEVKNPLPGGKCVHCGKEHPALDPTRKANMLAMGFTEEEIHRMFRQNAELYEASQVRRAVSASAERNRRYRARKKAEEVGSPTPRWASRRK